MTLKDAQRVVVLTGFLLILHASHCSAQPGSLRTHLDEHGSVPPVPQWFSCVHEMEDKPYNKLKSRRCLELILSHREVRGGRLSLKHYKAGDLLTFHIESPDLTVVDVDLGVGAADLARVHQLTEANGDTLRTGEPYEPRREADSRLVLDLLLRSQGRRAGVSRTLRLDYGKKTARATFEIWEGPPGEPEPLIPPYAPSCAIMNANFNSFDWDDFTPVEYIRRQMKTKWLGCFSEEELKDDEKKLSEVNFLKESKISVSGSGPFRNFALHFRSNPIPIAEVAVHGYGLLKNTSPESIPPLSIHSGDIYTNSLASDQGEALARAYQRTDRQLKVFTDVSVNSKGQAVLTFSLLAYADDTVYVNGRAFDVTHYREK